jgi:hypothetical protein
LLFEEEGVRFCSTRLGSEKREEVKIFIKKYLFNQIENEEESEKQQLMMGLYLLLLPLFLLNNSETERESEYPIYFLCLF